MGRCTGCAAQVADKLDLVVTLGGDGTVLWTGALLGTGPVPPLVPFALGSLGFMTPFPLDTMPAVLSSVRGAWPRPLHNHIDAVATPPAVPVPRAAAREAARDCTAGAGLPGRLSYVKQHFLAARAS